MLPITDSHEGERFALEPCLMSLCPVVDGAAGELKRVPGRRDLYRTKTHKKVYVRVTDDAPAPAASAEMR
jgi:hypothetical protein